MGGIRIAIDRGGTFTDCVGNPGSGKQEDDYILKLLSVDPSNYDDAPLEGIRRLLEKFTGKEYPRGVPIDTSNIEYIRMGTTVATNALLERKGERCALVTTKGFKDVLEIGNQSRPHIFDLTISKPDVLYETVVEIDERVTLEDYVEDPEQNFTAPQGGDLVKGLSNETVRILKRPEEDSIRSTLKLIYETGIRSIGVCLMHSYTFPDHEKIVGKIAEEIGFENISLSCELSPMIKFIPRTNSSIADAYLTPAIKKYLNGFESGLKDGLAAVSKGKESGVRCQFMQSDGGLVDASSFSGLRAILSGPAGGVVGYSETCFNPKNNIPLISFDMGGTSTDVSRYGDGKFDHVFETTTAGVTIQSPQLDINTVAAGGGSILTFKNGLFQVGPESASSQPGPACYRKGGPLTITDANLFLGRLLPQYFPKIFGPNENESLDYAASEARILEITEQINKAHPNNKPMTPHEVAYGFITVANETMSRPIRQFTEARGFTTASHRLVSFGGAGGQHSVAIAASLGISTVLIHRYSSVLSAYGMALADVVEDIQEPSSMAFSDDNKSALEERIASLKEKSSKALKLQGFNDSDIFFEEYLNLRFKGTEAGIMVSKSEDAWDFKDNFFKLHKREFGFIFDKDIIVDDVRVRAVGKSLKREKIYIDDEIEELKSKEGAIFDVTEDKVQFFSEVYFDNKMVKTPVYRLEELDIGTSIQGPAIIADGTQTNVIPPTASALILKSHIVVTNSFDSVPKAVDELIPETEQVGTKKISIDPVLLSIFGHRFMDIAHQMGTALQKTSVSVNVKERLDFSCALFDPEGNLVANAPHVPVHLGSMSTCVTKQANLWKGKLKPGDVLVTNHPSAGGTHLPDITVITPAFNGDELIFYVASRAHHADIGGLLPGSMPPQSKTLEQEGAAIYSELLVKDNQFQEERIRQLLLEEPAKVANCSGSRRISDNISDLNAQIAANHKGISLIGQLVNEFGLDTIIAYMRAIQDNAANTVSSMLKKVISERNGKVLEGVDYMDDGSKICLKVVQDPKDESKVIFDFTGTSQQAYNNINAPEAITYSAIIYCLRCLVDEDIPLNQGCLRPINVVLPDSSLLKPDSDCAVVGGNVCTSQIITGLILSTFEAAANSQSCCNNFTFGIGGNDEDGNYVQGFGYYETIAGGHGAGPSWDGINGVHTHMTNTRITDSEIFERRYPVLLREFSIRENSGGDGEHKGGCGVVRDIEFRVPVTASILSERRVIAPHGMKGGEDGERGINLWIRADRDPKTGEIVSTKTTNVGGKASVPASKGDRFVILTPGGGGYGKRSSGEITTSSTNKKVHHSDKFAASGSLSLRNETQLTN